MMTQSSEGLGRCRSMSSRVTCPLSPSHAELSGSALSTCVTDSRDACVLLHSSSASRARISAAVRLPYKSESIDSSPAVPSAAWSACRMGVIPVPPAIMPTLRLELNGYCIFTFGLMCLNSIIAPGCSESMNMESLPSGYTLTMRSKLPTTLFVDTGVYGRTIGLPEESTAEPFARMHAHVERLSGFARSGVANLKTRTSCETLVLERSSHGVNSSVNWQMPGATTAATGGPMV
eukprot:CAMPEP_0119426404 /NCGR_PEP_ID=MMETSP1335-20130426/36285_1 /TAXON_ID=259385 /ORGANISM="Chrysoculter rhomboideus, Strain RCC1486" /LENGTH=233 /DNA_ID=CAMNT_0007451997 /DNA_START=105 /DNA_END=806 /DNA_ORIENTATION=+